MKPSGSRYKRAKDLHISIPRVNDIVRSSAPLPQTPLSAWALLCTDAQTWMNLQAIRLRIARSKADIALSSAKATAA